MISLGKLWSPKPLLRVRLYKVEDNAKYWIFFFREPQYSFFQSIIVPKEASWEGMADAWERLHAVFLEAAMEAREAAN